QSLPMGAAIGGRHTATRVIIIPIRQRIVVRTTEGMVITIQRLTTTLLRERMVGNRQPTALTAPQRVARVTILTLALMREVLRFRPLTAAEARHRHITRTPAPMLRRDRARARALSGVVRMF